MKLPSLAEVRKSLLTLAGALGSVAASGIIQGTLLTKLTLAIAIIGAVATGLAYRVPNAKAEPAAQHEAA